PWQVRAAGRPAGRAAGGDGVRHRPQGPGQGAAAGGLRGAAPPGRGAIGPVRVVPPASFWTNRGGLLAPSPHSLSRRRRMRTTIRFFSTPAKPTGAIAPPTG